MMVSQKVHLLRCAATSSLRRTWLGASLLSFCAPCSWSFLRNHRSGDFLRDYQKIGGKSFTAPFSPVTLSPFALLFFH
jgi:hypothetical protein